MRLNNLVLLIFSGWFVLVSCGPEVQTSEVFKRYPGHPEAKRVGQAIADTLDPRRSATDDLSAGEAAPGQVAASATLHYLTGKFNPAVHPDFVVVGKPYTAKTGMFLRRETMAAFQKMWTAAKKDGVVLKIISSTRSFDQQRNIWEGKWKRFATETPDPETRARRILEYSAMPGASRHHWGTDIDLNDLNNAAFEAGGPYERVYHWLSQHAHEYGFCQPYTVQDANRPHGYKEEKWHWSYLPLSAPLLRQYRQTMRDELLTGFSGAGTASEIGIVQYYALGISKDCE